MRMGLAAVAAALLFSVQSASAVTVAAGETQGGTAGGINLVGGTNVALANEPGVWVDPVGVDLASVAGAADWVWIRDGGRNNGLPGEQLTFSFEFDLTGFVVESASLFGLANADNGGTISLNGTSLGSIAPFTQASDLVRGFSAVGSAGGFVDGLNTLLFTARNSSNDTPRGPAGFLASVTVTATPVPLPAGLPLLVAAVGGLALLRRRARRT